jgi:RNA polymerase sigma-70 factor (ECF subfamily)
MVVPAPLSDDVWDAVRSLPLRQRTAIALRYVSDLTQEEIAAVMDVAPGTVSATLVAARRRLGELLDDPSVTTGEDGP